MASYCKTLVSQRQRANDDTINEDRVTLLVLQALYLNGVLKCEYVTNGFLDGRITTLSEFSSMHKHEVNQAYVNTSALRERSPA